MTLLLTRTAADVFAPTTAGGEARGADMGESQSWGTEIERYISAAFGVTTTVQGGWDASAGTFPGSGTAAKGDAYIVTTAGTVDGQLFRVGDMVTAIATNASTATYAGNWVRFAAALDPVVFVTDAGAGTANAIQATATRQVSGDGGQLLSGVIFETNTSGTVTISITDSAGIVHGPYTIKTASGNPPAVGGLPAGLAFSGQIIGSNFAMLSDQASAAIQAAAEAALADLLLRYLGPHADDAAATAAAGGSPSVGQEYFDTTLDTMKVWRGDAWIGSGFSIGSMTSFQEVGDGATAIYNLDASAQESNTYVSVGGVTQAPYHAVKNPGGYTLVDGLLTFSANIELDEEIFCQTYATVPLGQNSALQTTLTDTAGHYASSNVEGALEEIGDVLASPAIVEAPADPSTFTGTDTDKVQQALDDGKAEIRINGTYTVTQIVPAAGNKLVFGRGQLIQSALGTDMVAASGLTDFTWSVDMLGVAPVDTTPSSVDDGLFLTDCDDVTIQDCKIENFRARPIFAVGGNRWLVRNVKFNNDAVGPRFIDIHTLRILYNDVVDKCLADSEFTTGIGLESTDGYGGRPVCEDVWIVGNKTKNMGASQGILVHGGIKVTCTDNEVTGSTIGISFNPYNSLDYITDPIISNNRIENDTLLTWDPIWGGNTALACQAGPPTPDIVRPIITGNVVVNGNRRKGGASEGGIQIGYATDMICENNVIRSSWACGIRVVDCPACVVSGNQVNTVVAASGQQYGAYITGSTGLIEGVFKDSGTAVDATGMTSGTVVSL